ncbi:MAG: hypothetical protein IKC20_06095, partial [Clostridia bacterium]|nr:hypothetical protein [Clostridia bacterium]
AGSISKNRPETFKRNGATVDLVWRNLDDDRKKPTKPVTTTTKPEETTTKAPATTEPTTQAPTTTQPIVTEPVVVG